MKDEIKEILELFAFTDENIMFGDIVELNSKQSHLLLDYITNLQEENKQLKDKNDYLNDILSSSVEYEELKTRIDKVKIEISELLNRYLFEEDFYIEDFHLDKVLKTLDGGDDNE